MRTIFIIYTILHINSNQFKITAVTDYHTVLTPAPIYDIIKDIWFFIFRQKTKIYKNERNTMMTRKKKNLISYVVFALVCVAIIIAGICYKNYSNEQKIKKAEKNAVTCVDDLTGKKIGVQIGTTGDIYASDYEGDKKGTVVERYNKGTDAIQALKDDKINCVILDEQPSLAYTEKNSELKILKEEFAVEDYAICIDKSNIDLKSKINDALKKLKDDGTLANIKKNYTGKDRRKRKVSL